MYHPDDVDGCPCTHCEGKGYTGETYLMNDRVCWMCNGTKINRLATIVAKTDAYIQAKGTEGEEQAWKILTQLFEQEVWRKTL